MKKKKTIKELSKVQLLTVRQQKNLKGGTEIIITDTQIF